jgi:very-short-patch-repair endonuclease
MRSQRNRLELLIDAHGGIVATHEFYDAGFTQPELKRAIGEHMIVRVRQGWYARPGLHPDLLQAWRVGGRLSCISGARLHGLWAPRSDILHLVVPPNGGRLRTRDDSRVRLSRLADPLVDIHWNTTPDTRSRLLLEPLACLEDIARCQPVEFAVAAADSAIRAGLIVEEEWHSMIARRPEPWRGELGCVDPRAGSGSESVSRLRLGRVDVVAEPQVYIAGVGWVDFLIGECLVIEVDGAEYHTDPERFEADRMRDARLSHLGYRVLRFSYEQVMFRWPEVELAVLSAIARGDHRHPAR